MRWRLWCRLSHRELLGTLPQGLRPTDTNFCLQLSPAAPQKLEAAVAAVALSVLYVGVVPVGPALGWVLILRLS